MCLSHIAKIDLVYQGPVVAQAWTIRFRLVINWESKQAKEAIQPDGGVAVKSNTTSNHDTVCRTSVAMHNATVQQPLAIVFSNSNPIIVTLQTEVGFVSKHDVFPFSGPCRLSLHHWKHKCLWYSVKGKRSNRRLANIPLCCKRRRMVRVDNK
ncbi:hypothetical protein TNCV_785591 [Trichonephila clavipes]|nr:hypothetical protein TNCV_785591 [Trichonephila clavipes]